MAQAELAPKPHEIPTVQQLLAELGFSGSIFTLEALHCQEKTLQTAKASGNDGLVQVTDKQPLAQTRRSAFTRLCQQEAAASDLLGAGDTFALGYS